MGLQYKVLKLFIVALLCICVGSMLVACGVQEANNTLTPTDAPSPAVTQAVTEVSEATQTPTPSPTDLPTSTPTPTTSPTPVPEPVERMHLYSPDGKTDVCIYSDEEGGWYYSVTGGEQDVVKKSRIGMVMQEGNLFNGLQLERLHRQ